MRPVTELTHKEAFPPSPRPVSAEPRKHSRLPARWGWWLAALIASALVTLWWLKRPGPEAATAYETTPVERRSIEAKVTATGTLSALVTVQVGSQVSGRIQEILVDYNSPVKKGQVIARIDPQLYQATVERSRASVLVAKANLQKAKEIGGQTEELSSFELAP